MPDPTPYDPDSPPSSAEWRGASEADRLQRVIAFHRAHPIKAGSVQAHAGIHVIVENQLAKPHQATVKALARLQQAGLSRHEAVHAIGSVYAKEIYGVLRNQGRPAAQDDDPQARIDAAIDAIDAQAWLNAHSD
ncbi:hypothetical protein [Piscinibacter sakaiensis]|uniref:hypothetical protein n=1 Tax=Piscinibacter sakaiensis TaxID=1547922 RepID=UPI003AAB09E2